jgi:hypothetical protein
VKFIGYFVTKMKVVWTKTVFDPEYVRCENVQGYDHISQYYFRPGEYDIEIDGDGNESDGGSNAE